MEELGKLIHEIFDDQKKEIAELKEQFLFADKENRRMWKVLEKVTDIIAPLVTKSSDGEWYMQSLWGKEFGELVNLLEIELKEEEEK